MHEYVVRYESRITWLFCICLYTQVDPKMLQLTMKQAHEVCVFCIHAVTFSVEIGIVSIHCPSNYIYNLLSENPAHPTFYENQDKTENWYIDV